MTIITTLRTRIRRPKLEDAEGLLQLGNDPLIQQFNCFSAPTLDKIMDYLNQVEQHPTRYVIASRETDEYIGEINFERDSLRYGVNATMLSYNLLPSYQGQGIMKEVMAAVLNYLFNDKGVDLVSARVFASNVISQKLLLRFGFTQEGYLRHAVRCNATQVNDDCLFSLLKGEYFLQNK